MVGIPKHNRDTKIGAKAFSAKWPRFLLSSHKIINFSATKLLNYACVCYVMLLSEFKRYQTQLYIVALVANGPQ